MSSAAACVMESAAALEATLTALDSALRLRLSERPQDSPASLPRLLRIAPSSPAQPSSPTHAPATAPDHTARSSLHDAELARLETELQEECARSARVELQLQELLRERERERADVFAERERSAALETQLELATDELQQLEQAGWLASELEARARELLPAIEAAARMAATLRTAAEASPGRGGAAPSREASALSPPSSPAVVQAAPSSGARAGTPKVWSPLRRVREDER